MLRHTIQATLQRWVVFCLAWFLAGTSWAGEITVFAAASLTGVLREMAIDYKRDTGDTLLLNFGASSLLARQLHAGARADLFFSADEEKMEGLEKAGLLLPGTRTNLLSNALVVIVEEGSSLELKTPRDLLWVKRLALAEPNTVPAGIYARRYLQEHQLWDLMKERIIPTENVRAALAAVEAGNAPCAMVYRTDALLLRQSRVALEIPPEQTPWITYPVGVLRETRQPEKARHLLRYLESKGARELFQKHGFITR